MPLYNLPNMTEGMDSVMKGTAQAVPVFFPMVLLFIYMIILIGGASAQRRREGSADMPMWAVVASIPIVMLSLILTIEKGIVQKEVLVTVIIVAIASGLWFFMSRGRGEY